jgi:catechol 2,3-dioxygenase-like lactoylglutathione lyase family enzyme
MTVSGLDHVNLRVRDVAGTLRFLEKVLGLEVTPGPGRQSMENGAWAYSADGHPVVHIGNDKVPYPSDAERPFEARTGSGAIHHVAFRCTGFEEMKLRLDDKAIVYWENHVPQITLRQIFVTDPNDILYELNFFGA